MRDGGHCASRASPALTVVAGLHSRDRGELGRLGHRGPTRRELLAGRSDPFPARGISALVNLALLLGRGSAAAGFQAALRRTKQVEGVIGFDLGLPVTPRPRARKADRRGDRAVNRVAGRPQRAGVVWQSWLGAEKSGWVCVCPDSDRSSQSCRVFAPAGSPEPVAALDPSISGVGLVEPVSRQSCQGLLGNLGGYASGWPPAMSLRIATASGVRMCSSSTMARTAGPLLLATDSAAN